MDTSESLLGIDFKTKIMFGHDKQSVSGYDLQQKKRGTGYLDKCMLMSIKNNCEGKSGKF
jgi:hypothetical protein